jgi:hypothetical protein
MFVKSRITTASRFSADCSIAHVGTQLALTPTRQAAKLRFVQGPKRSPYRAAASFKSD